MLELDVTLAASVAAAAREIAAQRGSGPAPLRALVNNAGIGGGGALRDVLAVNLFGIQRTCEALLPLLEPAGGRIVNVTSAAGPSFVASCSAERQRFLTDPRIEWPALRAVVDECLAIEGGPAAVAARGLGDGNAYGLSKACANAYTLILAREHPDLAVCSSAPTLAADVSTAVDAQRSPLDRYRAPRSAPYAGP